MINLDEYAIVIKRNGSTFFAEVPDLPGCMTQGMTAQETWEAIEDAKRLWVDSHLKEGRPIPPPEFFKKVSKAVGRHW